MNKIERKLEEKIECPIGIECDGYGEINLCSNGLYMKCEVYFYEEKNKRREK